LFIFHTTANAQDKIMGQIQFIASSKAVKTSGVWIDGQYVGYLGELKGSSRLRLLPGEHDVLVRQAGYTDFTRKAVIEPGLILDVHVEMGKDSAFRYPEPKSSSEVKLEIQPERAAVFLDDYFVGHVEEYFGVGRAMVVTPGKHRIKIALAGYRAFETDVDLLPHQKFTLKTDLLGGSIADADPLIRADAPRTASSSNQGEPRAAQ